MQAIRTLRSSARQGSFARDASDAGVERSPSATLGWSALVAIPHGANLGRSTSGYQPNRAPLEARADGELARRVVREGAAGCGRAPWLPGSDGVFRDRPSGPKCRCPSSGTAGQLCQIPTATGFVPSKHATRGGGMYGVAPDSLAGGRWHVECSAVDVFMHGRISSCG